MYRGHPSWSCPWNWAVQLGQGEGPIGIVGPMSQPRSVIDTASLTLNHTHAFNMRFLLYFSTEIVFGVLVPVPGGTNTEGALYSGEPEFYLGGGGWSGFAVPPGFG